LDMVVPLRWLVEEHKHSCAISLFVFCQHSVILVFRLPNDVLTLGVHCW
jgi:hypothetical protein